MIKTVGQEENGARLDKYLNKILIDFSRTKIQKMIKDGDVKVNERCVKVGYKTAVGDEIFIDDEEKIVEELKKEDIPVEIIYDAKDYFLVNKPPRMVVHPSETGHQSGTLVNAILDKVEDGVGESFRPGIVHRLDKDTSGAMIVAKTQKGYEYFVDLFKSRTIEKVYLALVRGHLDHKKGVIDSPIGRAVLNRKKMAVVSEEEGKNAVSIYRVVEEFTLKNGSEVSLVEVEIKTGRTHQIRVHMAAIEHPVVGDVTYGIRSFNSRFEELFGLDRQFLHAHKIAFKDMYTDKTLEFISDMPEDLTSVLKELRTP